MIFKISMIFLVFFFYSKFIVFFSVNVMIKVVPFNISICLPQTITINEIIHLQSMNSWSMFNIFNVKKKE